MPQQDVHHVLPAATPFLARHQQCRGDLPGNVFDIVWIDLQGCVELAGSAR